MNMLVFLAAGVGVDSPRPSAVCDFALTSHWQPTADTLAAFHFSGFVQQSMNHSVEMVRDAYASIGPLESVPFYW